MEKKPLISSFLFSFLLTLTLTHLSYNASAIPVDHPDIRLGFPSYGGTGCPAGSASVVLSPDNRSLHLILDQYEAEAGGGTGRKIDRKSCQLAIPVHVPAGLSISFGTVRLEGNASLPRGTSGKFQSEYFLAGSRGPVFNKTFTPGHEGIFTIENRLGLGSTVWSPCGADVNLRINTSVVVESTDEGGPFGRLQIEGTPQTGPAITFQWRRC